MKAVRVSRFGGPEVLEVIEVPKPEVRAGEALIRVCAAGVNFFEILMRADRYAVTPSLPIFLGVEVAGVVEEVGAGANLQAGDRVAVPLFAIGRDGGYADYIAVDAAAAIPVPDKVSFEEAVALLVQGLTALHSVRRVPPAGKTVLVTAAGGGVGTLLVQLAKNAGAKSVIAAASNDDKLSLAQSLGADAVVNCTANGWGLMCRQITDGKGADIAYDFVGGDLTRSVLEGLAPRGELLFGALGRFSLDASDLDRMFENNQSLTGMALLPLLNPENLRADIGELFALAARGELRAVIGGRFPLRSVADSHTVIEARGNVGKIVLVS